MKIQSTQSLSQIRPKTMAAAPKVENQEPQDSADIGHYPGPSKARIAGIVGGALALGGISGLLVGNTPQTAALMVIATAIGGIAGYASFCTDMV